MFGLISAYQNGVVFDGCRGEKRFVVRRRIGDGWIGKEYFCSGKILQKFMGFGS